MQELQAVDDVERNEDPGLEICSNPPSLANKGNFPSGATFHRLPPEHATPGAKLAGTLQVRRWTSTTSGNLPSRFLRSKSA